MRWPGCLLACTLCLLLSCAGSSPQDPLQLALPQPDPRAPQTPGPFPRHRTFDAVAMNARCEQCHHNIASEWRDSLHRASHTDASYRRQFAVEPLPFCTSCHAPEANPFQPVPDAVSELGVGCVTCHVVGDKILAAPVPGSAASAEEVPHHRVTRLASFAGAMACAGCHEFAFPDAPPKQRPDTVLMQSTMREHEASAYAHKSCADCHMPRVASAGGSMHRSHRFVASRDDDYVRSAVRSSVHVEDGVFTLTLAPGAVGHAFPTGDVLRRLTVTIAVVDGHGAVKDGLRKRLGRHFSLKKRRHRQPQRVLLRDDRVGVNGQPLEIVFRPKVLPRGGAFVYRVTYERVAGPPDAQGEVPLESATLLTEGELPLSGPR